MIKKIVVASGVALAGLCLASQSSLIRSYWTDVRASVQKQVTPERKLAMVREQLKKLPDLMEKNKSRLAELEYQVKKDREKVETIQANLDEQKQHLLQARADLKAGSERISYRGRICDRTEAQRRIDLDLTAYELCAKQLDNEKQGLEAKLEAMNATRAQMINIRKRQVDLEMRIVKIETDLAKVRASQANNRFELDEGPLAAINASLDEVEKQVGVMTIKQTIDGEFGEPKPAPAKAPSAADIVRRLDSLDAPVKDTKEVKAGKN